MRRDADVALVLPVAGGKTLLLMLLARVEALGVTIVILPFRALLDDLARRCQQHDVPYSTWTAGSRDKDCQLVLATAEQVLLPAFDAWATRLHTARKLHRIVLDDAHLMLTALTVHQQLEQLRQLCALSVLWGVVSATLPPAALLDLAQWLLLPQPLVLHASACCRQLAYTVLYLQRHKELAAKMRELLLDELNALAALDATPHNGDWRAIVFCRSQRLCSNLVRAFGAAAHHGGMGAAECVDALAEW